MARARRWDSIEDEVVGEYDVFSIRRHVMRSPRTGDLHEFHIIEVPVCVQVIPFTHDGRMILVDQFRPGVQRVSLEFPAGRVEPGENPLAAATRELEEETGYRAGRVDLLGDFDADASIQSNEIKVIVARDCRPDGQRDQDDGEDVEVRIVDRTEVSTLIEDGHIRHAASISAWHLYERLTGRSGATEPGTGQQEQ